MPGLLISVACAALLVLLVFSASGARAQTQDQDQGSVEPQSNSPIAADCYCDTETCVNNSCTLNRGLRIGNLKCAVLYNKDTGVLAHFCHSPITPCISTGEVLKGCCHNSSGCNRCLLPLGLTYDQCLNITLPPGCPTLICAERFFPSTSTESTTTGSNGTGLGLPDYQIAIIVVIAVIAVLLLALVLVILYICRKRQNSQPKEKHTQKVNDEFDSGYTLSSGRGEEKVMIERTIADDIVLEDCIDSGGFGSVQTGSYNGQTCAVKIYKDSMDPSYERERRIVTSGRLTHENVARYWAADSKDNQLWIIMDYYPLGSLSTFLRESRLTPSQTVTILRSIASGLQYLHRPYHSTHGKTHGVVAHRDIKSPNILVKTNEGMCVITDFGLSVTESDFERGAPPIKVVVGTNRYLAPEILSDTINQSYIEAFCTTDIYSYGLIMWEVLRRMEIDGSVLEYEVPYCDYLPKDPSMEEVRAVVVEQAVRPELDCFSKDIKIVRLVISLMKESWYANPDGRPTATRLKKKLDDLEPFLKISFN